MLSSSMPFVCAPACRLVSTQVCQSLSETLSKVGASLVQLYTSDVAQMALGILQKNTLAHTVTSDNANADAGAAAPVAEEEDLGPEYEALYVTSALDVVVALADVLGADFAPLFAPLLPAIAKYTTAPCTNTERASAQSALGHVAANLRTSVTPFTADLFPALARGLVDEDAPTRTAALYAVGVLVQFSEHDLRAYYAPVLQTLASSFDLPGTDPDMATGSDTDALPADLAAQRDNAAGCLARMVRRHPHALPLGQTLPLVFGALPIRADAAEWVPVVQMCLALLAADEPAAEPFKDSIQNVFSCALAAADEEGENPLDEELRADVLPWLVKLGHEQ